MRKPSSLGPSVRLITVLMALTLVACGEGAGQQGGEAPPQAPPSTETDHPGAALVQRRCTMCHGTDRIFSKDYDAAKWDETIERMKRNGLVITEDEKQQVIDYLLTRSAK